MLTTRASGILFGIKQFKQKSINGQMETCKDEPNKRATPGAENTANKQRPADIYDAKLKNYIHIICAGDPHTFSILKPLKK